jgi:hypothetical protein
MLVDAINSSCWVATPHILTRAWHCAHTWLVSNSQICNTAALRTFLSLSSKRDALVGEGLYPNDEDLNVPVPYATTVLPGYPQALTCKLDRWA